MVKRVLFVARHLDAGGITTQMYNLATGLQQCGWKVAVASRGLAGDHERGPDWFEKAGIRHYAVRFPTAYKSVPHNAILTLQGIHDLRQTIKEFSPDLLHVHWRSTGLFARLTGIPFVITLHTERIPDSLRHRLLSVWGKHCIANSRQTARELIERFGLPKKAVSIIYYGLDDTHFRPPTTEERAQARRALDLPDDAFVANMVARLHPDKAQEVLVRAIASLKREDCAVHAVFAGTSTNRGLTEEKLQALARDEGVQTLVHLLGDSDSRTVYWASDLSVLSSRQEGFGLVTAEAQLCGLVPIRTLTAGAEDQIEDGKSGFIVPLDDPAVIAARIKQLMQNDALRADMSRCALESARNKFTSSRMIEAYISVYETVIGT